MSVEISKAIGDIGLRMRVLAHRAPKPWSKDAPTLEQVLEALTCNPGVRAEWLLLGTGNIYKPLDDASSYTYNVDASRVSVEGHGLALATGHATANNSGQKSDALSSSIEHMAAAIDRLEAKLTKVMDENARLLDVIASMHNDYERLLSMYESLAMARQPHANLNINT